MIDVRPCRSEDIPGVASLHRRLFHGVDRPPSRALVAYYRETFFGNPWRRDDMPSLAAVRGDGEVVGFRGVIPRPMTLGAREVWAAVSHRLMVRADAGPQVAARLAKAYLAGPQELSFADGTNDAGLKLVRAYGSKLVPLYSMRWILPVRPLSFALEVAGRRAPLSALAAVAAPLGRAADRLLPRLLGAGRTGEPDEGRVTPLDPGTLLTAIEEFSRPSSLRPKYDERSLRWVLQRLAVDESRGRLEGFALRDGADRVVGTCLYAMRPRDSGEVLQIAAASTAAVGAVLRWLFHRAWSQGLTHVYGRVEPHLVEALFEANAIVRRGACWMHASGKDPRVVDAIFRGEAFLTALEGELIGSALESFAEDEGAEPAAPGAGERPWEAVSVS